MAECNHTWQVTGGESHPESIVEHERCTRCGEQRSIETPRAVIAARRDSADDRKELLRLAVELETLAARVRAVVALMDGPRHG